jgi:hypothetical protein
MKRLSLIIIAALLLTVPAYATANLTAGELTSMIQAIPEEVIGGVTLYGAIITYNPDTGDYVLVQCLNAEFVIGEHGEIQTSGFSVLWLWDADNGEWINRWQALDIWLWITDLTVIYTTIPITQDGVTISPPGVQINPGQQPDDTTGQDNPDNSADIAQAITIVGGLIFGAIIGLAVVMEGKRW